VKNICNGFTSYPLLSEFAGVTFSVGHSTEFDMFYSLFSGSKCPTVRYVFSANKIYVTWLICLTIFQPQSLFNLVDIFLQ
jgi:hypothetical protein